MPKKCVCVRLFVCCFVSLSTSRHTQIITMLFALQAVEGNAKIEREGGCRKGRKKKSCLEAGHQNIRNHKQNLESLQILNFGSKRPKLELLVSSHGFSLSR